MKTWDLILLLAKFAYNNSVNMTTIEKTFFEVVYGYKLQHTMDLVELLIDIQVSSDVVLFAKHVQRIHEGVEIAIETGNENYKLAANQH